MTDPMDAYVETEFEMPGGDLPADPLAPADGHPDETLLDQLDRRQNTVLEELDELDARIEALVHQCQQQRTDAA